MSEEKIEAGIRLENMGDHTGAISIYKEYLESHGMMNGQGMEAKPHLKNVSSELNASVMEAHFRLGVLLDRIGEIDDSTFHFGEVLRADFDTVEPL